MKESAESAESAGFGDSGVFEVVKSCSKFADKCQMIFHSSGSGFTRTDICQMSDRSFYQRMRIFQQVKEIQDHSGKRLFDGIKFIAN